MKVGDLVRVRLFRTPSDKGSFYLQSLKRHEGKIGLIVDVRNNPWGNERIIVQTETKRIPFTRRCLELMNESR